MVRSIVVDETVVHWIEIEPRAPGDHHQSPVFRQGGTLHLTAVVTKLLEVASGLQGVWPGLTALPGLTPARSIGRAALWSHRDRKAIGTDAGQAAVAPLLSGAGALASIREAAFG